jgi:hypothetical protein
MMRKVRRGKVGGARNAAVTQPPRTPASKIAMNRLLDIGFGILVAYLGAEARFIGGAGCPAEARAYHGNKSEKQIPFGNDNKKCQCSNKCKC